MSSHTSRWFAGLGAALLVAACSELPPAPIPPAPPPPPPAPVASVTVSPATHSILVGTAVQLSATTKDAQGNTLSGRGITWSSNAEAIATVDAAGLVTGVSAGGPITITATSEGRPGTAQVTVTTPGLGFSISLSAATLSIVQGASTPTTTVNITRSAHQASVGLYVTGLPTGVTDSFDPVSWPVGNSTVLTLTVAATAVPGIYNLQVNAYDPEQEGEVSTPLTLTVTAPPPAPGYTLSLSASTLSIPQGASTPTTTVNLLRHSYTGPVTLYVLGTDDHDWYALPPGVTAAFSSNPATGDSSVLTLSVDAAAVPGVYYVRVGGEASTGWFETLLTLTVTAVSP